jgi:glycosyltransferase involved in cell wall biosynthesis
MEPLLVMKASMPNDAAPQHVTGRRKQRTIFLAGPSTPKGGGMFKVADYLVQWQALPPALNTAELRLLDTRGEGNALSSLWVLTQALGKLLMCRLKGELAGVHVNVAERLSLFRKGVVIVASRALGVPVVLHSHAAQLHHFYPTLPRPLQVLTRWVFALPKSCLVLGQVSRQFVIEQLGVPAQRVEIISNGVPEPTETRRQPSAGDVQRVLFVGNLSERKGVSDLLGALALPSFNRRQVEVQIAGGGDVTGYQAQANAMGLSRWVHFSGWVGQPEVARLMAAADVLVLPSYDEGLPLVILEALANGVAVVCSPVGEISTVLTDEVNAIFVQAGNVHELSAGLQRVLRDPLLRQSLEQNGRLLYEQKFSLQRFFIEVARVHFQHFGVSARSRPCDYNNQAETTPQHDHSRSVNTPVLSVADTSSAEVS